MDDYSLLKFLTLDLTDEGSIDDVLLCIDNAIQYGEDAEVKINYPEVSNIFRYCSDRISNDEVSFRRWTMMTMTIEALDKIV